MAALCLSLRKGKERPLREIGQGTKSKTDEKKETEKKPKPGTYTAPLWIADMKHEIQGRRGKFGATASVCSTCTLLKKGIPNIIKELERRQVGAAAPTARRIGAIIRKLRTLQNSVKSLLKDLDNPKTSDEKNQSNVDDVANETKEIATSVGAINRELEKCLIKWAAGEECHPCGESEVSPRDLWFIACNIAHSASVTPRRGSTPVVAAAVIKQTSP